MILDAIPAAFLDRMARLLGSDEYVSFVASFAAPQQSGLRVNTLKITPHGFVSVAPFPLSPVPWDPSGFTVPDSQRPGRHAYHSAGLYYVQEPSAMLAAALLAPQPGERVLDLSAAPGGKTTHIAALMDNQGLLVANEIHPKRVWDLAENLERWGARNVAITNETPERLAERFENFFDRVLVDAPCSGEGMMRKSAAARREWSPSLVEGCASRQTIILDAAARLVRPGGRLVYSTCTFAPQENEGSVARFLAAHRDYALIQPLRCAEMSFGRPEWLPAELASRFGDEIRKTVRMWPHRNAGDGHFIAVLERSLDGPESDVRPWRAERLPVGAERLYRDFCRATLDSIPSIHPSGQVVVAGSYLYAVPAGLPDLTGLRFIHPGWWLGILKKNRFEPSHALALGLRLRDALQTENLRATDERLASFLQGESWTSPGDPGWVIVAVDGFPLGWAKRVDNRLKSHYPRGLRRL